MSTRIYDKVLWHVETTDKSLVIKYFTSLMEFLTNHQLLNDEGKEIFEFGVDVSLSINSKMLTNKGNKLLSFYYDEFLKSVDFNKDADFKFLEKYI
ncbi:MAG: hypothetical protein LBR26_09415 [Prevotella sp.]|jgi:hypothetical protein|nr:hypothetical protein [Prevotella sp.]